jgi:hypothetical protein
MKWRNLAVEKPLTGEASVPVLVRTEDDCYFSARYFVDDEGMAQWYFYFDNSVISADASDLWIPTDEFEKDFE